VRCPESLEPEFQSRDLRKKVDAWNSWLGPAVPSEKSRSQDRFWRETRPRVPIEQGPVANNESWESDRLLRSKMQTGEQTAAALSCWTGARNR